MQLLFSKTGRILIEGHRGAEGLAAPNSLDAIIAGYEAGADFLEIDVQKTSDGQLVIYHSYQLPDGRWIRDVRSHDLFKECINDRKILTLEEVFGWAKDKEIKFSLDIKNGFGFDPQVFLDTLACVEDYNMVQRVMFIGWDHPSLLILKDRNPDVVTRILIRGRPVDLVQVVQAAKADAVNLDADMVTREEVDALHAAEIAVVIAETVNPDYSRPISLRADMVCCRDPKAAKMVLHKDVLVN
jgi:glycerophosphoryl diester phosphodiesterase